MAGTAGKGKAVAEASHHRLRALQTLLDISFSLHRFLDLDALIQHLNRKVMELFSVEAVSVLIYDDRNRDLILNWVENRGGECGEVLKKARVPLHGSIAGKVFRTGKTQLVSTADQDCEHYGKLDQLTGFQTRSMIAAPLPAKDRTIGVLEVINPGRAPFSDSDVQFIESFAGIVGLALDNARVVTELEQANKRLLEIDEARSRMFQKTQDENVRLRREIEKRYRFDQIIGCSDSMLEVFRLCEKAIDSDITVLIEGETGTGKELVARCIHFNGPRRSKPFVGENCSAIPQALLAGELFGHTKGAFTGATAQHRGLFEMADGGTLFVDEVAELDMEMQKSFLRVLEQGEIRPLGSSRSRKIDVRIISATNKVLEEEVAAGRFRDDLYYRLSVFRIVLPPLRERIGDIPLLAHHFVEELNKGRKVPIDEITQEAIDCLSLYSFPGNVRELRNEIQRAMAMAGARRRVDAGHLSEKIHCKAPLVAVADCSEGTLKEMVSRLEKTVIESAMRVHGGNKTRAARHLGLSRYGLIKKIRRYGLEGDRRVGTEIKKVDDPS